MISNVTSTINHLTNTIAFSFNERNMMINEFAIQKLIYKIKMEIGEKHPLYNKLPYYWYCHGPVCEPLHASYNNIQKYCDENHEIKDKYQYKFTAENETVTNYPEINNIINNILDKGNYVYNNLAEDIYKQYAPYEVQYPFKYTIFNETKNKTFTQNGNDYVKSFRYCQSKFPIINYFTEFDIIFTGFTSRIDLLNEDYSIGKCWNILRKPIHNLWFTYAKGLRILSHDPFYDENCRKWHELFKLATQKSKYDLYNIVSKTDRFIDFSNYEEYTKDEEEIIKITLGNYLMED